MDKLIVDLKERSYDILFSDNFSGLCEALKKINAPKRILIVTDTNVDKLYGYEIKSLLMQNNYNVDKFAFEAGEQNKTMNTILDICNACINHKMDRKSMIVALGGGVVGDMAGFAAAIYMRGIDFVQIPTTLLSQSDSSIGGKTGIDFMDCKNILGAFHQPKLVYINVSTLKTLPSEQFVSGMGEVIKHGIIQDKDFFEYLETNTENIKALNPETLIKADKINCTVKSNVVMQDERENGLRAILNFGHTIGHAVESAFNFTMTHGECVAIGMIAASYISYKRDYIKLETLSRIEKILELYNFKTRIELPNKDLIFKYMLNDKKKLNDELKFILPTGIGNVIQSSASKEEIYSALDYISK